MLWQAVSEGDALKVDKRRKKKKREEEVDALFGDSDEDDGGDYDPNAPEEAYVEYLDGERQPQANGGGDAGRNALAGTGARLSAAGSLMAALGSDLDSSMHRLE